MQRIGRRGSRGVDEDVDLAHRLDRGERQVSHLMRVGNVAAERKSLEPALPNLTRDVDDLLLVARRDRNRGTGVSQGMSGCSTDSTPPARDDDGLAGQVPGRISIEIQSVASSAATTASASSSPSMRTVLWPSSEVARAGQPK